MKTIPDSSRNMIAEKSYSSPQQLTAMVATKGGPTMLARIGVMRALSRHVERVFEPSGKKHHWDVASSRATDDTRYLRDLPTVVPSRELAPPLIGPGMPMQVVVPSVS